MKKPPYVFLCVCQMYLINIREGYSGSLLVTNIISFVNLLFLAVNQKLIWA